MIITMDLLLPCRGGAGYACRMPTRNAVVYQDDDGTWKLIPACERHLPAVARTHPNATVRRRRSDGEERTAT